MSTRPRTTVLLIISLFLSSLLNACTSFQPVAGSSPQAVAGTLEAGDHVEVLTVQGETYQFVVREVTTEAIVGDQRTVPFDEIQQIKVKQIDEDKVRTATQVALAVPLVILAVGLVALMSLDGGAIGIPGP